MSLISGAWQHIENDPAATLEKMYEAVNVFPHEKYSFHIHHHVAFAHMLTYNTPEAAYENQPVYLPDRKILFTAQGRIDNRAGLAQLLNIKIDDRYADGSLILQAYLKWGKSCVYRLRGDWSFAAFDGKEQELFIARDPMGYTALYYYQDDHGFYFSSSIKSLLSIPGYKKRLNEEHLVRTLTLWDDDTLAVCSTYYADIYSLPNNSMLTVRNKKVTIEKYWQPQNIPLRRYKNRQDYADEMYGMLTTAVRSSLRSYKPVATMLSGGLDSSTVSVIAAGLLKTENKMLSAFSHVPLFTNEIVRDKESNSRTLDETPFIMEVARASGNIEPKMLNSSHYSVLQGIKDTIDAFDRCTHGAANLYWVQDIYRQVAAGGFGTLLSGEGGNGTISFAALDYLLPFSFERFRLNPYLFLKNQVAKPIVFRYFNKWMNKTRSTGHRLESYVMNIFASQPVLEKYEIIEDIRKNNKELHKYYPDIIERKKLFIDLYNPRSVFGAACGQHYGFELRDPTVDVDLMEYFFSIPNEVFFDERYNNRMLVKRMMKGKIPDKVLFEKKKGLQSADIAYRVKAQAQELTQAIETVKRSPAANHYIDTEKLSETWQQYLLQPYVQPYQLQRLLKALQFALFLQKNFD